MSKHAHPFHIQVQWQSSFITNRTRTLLFLLLPALLKARLRH